MLVILIIVCAMVFFFCIFTIILHGIAKDKLKVEERIKDFVLEEKEERKKTTTKQKRLKVKKNTGFKTRKLIIIYLLRKSARWNKPIRSGENITL